MARPRKSSVRKETLGDGSIVYWRQLDRRNRRSASRHPRLQPRGHERSAGARGAASPGGSRRAGQVAGPAASRADRDRPRANRALQAGEARRGAGDRGAHRCGRAGARRARTCDPAAVALIDQQNARGARKRAAPSGEAEADPREPGGRQGRQAARTQAAAHMVHARPRARFDRGDRAYRPATPGRRPAKGSNACSGCDARPR